jgi:hypothetical protein
MTLQQDEHQPPPSHDSKFWAWKNIKVRAKEIILFLPEYLRNPVEGIKHAPAWDWSTVLLLEILFSASTGLLTGIVARHFLAIIGGLILSPIVGVILSFIVSGLIHYTCLFLMKTEVEFKKVFIIVVLAKIPSQILGILVPLIKFIPLIGIIVTALLLIIGISDNFMLDRKKVSRIIGTIATITLLFWLYTIIIEVSSNHIKVQDYTPDSLDQIHKELNESK